MVLREGFSLFPSLRCEYVSVGILGVGWLETTVVAEYLDYPSSSKTVPASKFVTILSYYSTSYQGSGRQEQPQGRKARSSSAARLQAAIPHSNAAYITDTQHHSNSESTRTKLKTFPLWWQSVMSPCNLDIEDITEIAVTMV